LFVLIGSQPRTQWLGDRVARDPQGFILTGADLPIGAGRRGSPARPPLPLETSLPGVFAAGDARHGSVKRVASAVGEGAATIPLVHRYLQAAPVNVPAPTEHNMIAIPQARKPKSGPDYDRRPHAEAQSPHRIHLTGQHQPAGGRVGRVRRTACPV